MKLSAGSAVTVWVITPRPSVTSPSPSWSSRGTAGVDSMGVAGVVAGTEVVKSSPKRSSIVEVTCSVWPGLLNCLYTTRGGQGEFLSVSTLVLPLF